MGNHRIVRLLLQSGAEVNDSSGGSSTALTSALNGNDNECIRLLIKAGAKSKCLSEWDQRKIENALGG